MKRKLLTLTLAVLTVGLLGSCSKINERIDGLDQRVSNIENEKIASIENQIAAINASIADLGAIRKNIADLQVAVGDRTEEISKLKEADKAIGQRIDELKAYVGDLSKYAEEDWVKATFATLEQLKSTNTALSALEEKVGKLGESTDSKIAGLKTELTNSINSAISGINATISTLEGRVAALEQMIQTVSIVPAYSDGSVEVDDKDSLYIDFIVNPATVVARLDTTDVVILVNKVKTKAFAGVDSIKIGTGDLFEKDAAKGTVSVRVSAAGKIPAVADSTITVAVNVKNGISDFTTKFVPVTLPVSVSLDKHSILVSYSTTSRDTTLTATVKNSIKGVTWTSSNTDIATVDNAGKVTIKANVSGKDTIVVKTVEGAKTDTCFVTVLPAGALAGEFSVSATKKVYFSKGNLYADGSKALYFEANQHSSASSWDASHVSHFTWSSTVEAAVGNSNSGDNLFCDESHKVSVDGGEAIYYALSKDEWTYLFNTRNNASSLYKYGVTVCGKQNCVVLLPDNWEWKESTVGKGWQTDYPETKTGNEVTWEVMEKAGAVCLPAAGCRTTSTTISNVGGSGDYWSSSANGSEYACSVYFSSTSFSPDYSDGDRCVGGSVRLITE